MKNYWDIEIIDIQANIKDIISFKDDEPDLRAPGLSLPSGNDVIDKGNKTLIDVSLNAVTKFAEKNTNIKSSNHKIQSKLIFEREMIKAKQGIEKSELR